MTECRAGVEQAIASLGPHVPPDPGRDMKLVLDLAVKHALEAWSVWGHSFEGVLLVKRGNSRAGARLLRTAFDTLPEGAFQLHTTLLLAELAEGLGGTGQIAEGLVVIDDALARAERTEGRWCIAELLRQKGELLLRRHASAAAEQAEECFRQALDRARRQGALCEGAPRHFALGCWSNHRAPPPTRSYPSSKG